MFLIKVKPRDYKKLAVKFACFLILGTIWSFIAFDALTLKIIKMNSNLKPGSYARKIYVNLPFPLTFKVYIFDILNKDEVQNGAKPRFREIGPYVFHEYISKINTIDDEEADTLEFTLWKKYVFRPELSNGLTGDEIITTLHPVINAIGLTIHFEHQAFFHVAVAAINELFHNPTDAFWTGRAMDMIFDGIKIDCSTTNPLGKLACGEIRNAGHQAIQKIDDKTFKFSLLGGFNNSSNGVFKVLRGSNNYRELGQVIEADGKTKLKIWKGDKCNRIKGTDGLIFPPLQPADEPIWIFLRMLCHSRGMNFTRKSSFRGISTHVFTEDFGDITNNADEHCFCRNKNACPVKGTIDLLPCLRVPITGSLPHFLHAHLSLLENIGSGLHPNEKLHEFFLNMELASGMPLSGAKRFQLNFELEPVPQIQVMANLPKMLFPWLWIEESAEIPDSYIDMLKYLNILPQSINKILKFISVTVGLIGSIYCLTIFLLSRVGGIKVVIDQDTNGEIGLKSIGNIDKDKEAHKRAKKIIVESPPVIKYNVPSTEYLA